MIPRYIPRHFIAQELVTPHAHSRLGDGALLLMDDRIIMALDAVRDLFERPIIVNTWHVTGGFTQRGWRDDAEVGGRFSQHRFGRAVDFDVEGYTAEDVRQAILDTWRYSEALQGITRMEAGTSWVHIDCAPIAVSKPMLFNP